MLHCHQLCFHYHTHNKLRLPEFIIMTLEVCQVSQDKINGAWCGLAMGLIHVLAYSFFINSLVQLTP